MNFTFWLKAFRAYSFPASIAPVLLGSAFAYWQTGLFNLTFFALAMIAGVCYHITVNLLNDVYDYERGVDTADSLGGSGVLVSQETTSKKLLVVAYSFCAVGTLIGVYFVSIIGVPMLLLGALGLVGVFGYTRSGISAKYIALGLPLVALTMGSGMVLGGYITQTGELTFASVLISLPLAFMVAAILQANDTRDITFDRQAKITTFSTILGATGARSLLSALLFGSFACVIWLVLDKRLPPLCLIAVLALPAAIKIHRVAFNNPAEYSVSLIPLVEATAKLHMALGVLLAVALVLSHI